MQSSAVSKLKIAKATGMATNRTAVWFRVRTTLLPCAIEQRQMRVAGGMCADLATFSILLLKVILLKRLK